MRNHNTGRCVPSSKTWFCALFWLSLAYDARVANPGVADSYTDPGTDGASPALYTLSICLLSHGCLEDAHVHQEQRVPCCTYKWTGFDSYHWQKKMEGLLQCSFFFFSFFKLYLLIESQYAGQEAAVLLPRGLFISIPLIQQSSLTCKVLGDCEASQADAGFGEKVVLSLCGQLYIFLITSSRICVWIVTQELGHNL